MWFQEYGEDAISLMQNFPCANKNVRNENQFDVFSECRPADLEDEIVLKLARKPYLWEAYCCSGGATDHIVRTSEGLIVMLGIEPGQ